MEIGGNYILDAYELHLVVAKRQRSEFSRVYRQSGNLAQKYNEYVGCGGVCKALWEGMG